MADLAPQATDTTASSSGTPTVDTPPTAPPKKGRKSGGGCMLPMLLIVATVGFAPQIITMTSLRNQVPSLLIAELPPGVQIGSATAGWVSPMQLNDVVIPDDQGRPSLKLKHVTLSRSLWELAQSTTDLGVITIEKPELKLLLDHGVSNYDKFLSRLSAKKGDGARSLIDLQLKAGEITIREESRPAPAQPADVNVDTISPADETAPIAPQLGEVLPDVNAPDDEPAQSSPPKQRPPVQKSDPVEGPLLAIIDLEQATFRSQAAGEEELVGELTAKLREPAVEQSLTGQLRWNLPDANAEGIGSGKLKVTAPSLPLAVLTPWLASFTSGRDLGGVVSLDVAAEVVPSGKDLLLAAQVSIPHLDLQLGPADAQSQPFRWTGDNLQLIAEGQGDLAGQLVTFESVQLRTPIINADFSGTVKDLSGPALCELTGKCDLNPAELLASLPAEWADRVRFEGLKLGEIRVDGALRSIPEVVAAPSAIDDAVTPTATPMARPLSINADIQWTAANVMGFQSQNALVKVDWSEKQLAINPNRLPIGSGQWVASPRIEFTPEGKYLVFDGGPVFENVDFTQEMSNTWLRYVSPILGSATSIEGQFSLSASPVRVAMSPPYSGEFEGVIDIHTAQVGPGPLTRQIFEAIAGIQMILGRQPAVNAQWMRVDAQKVPFAYVEGRVYHKDLKVGFGDVVIQSQGSVGLDETIDFQIGVPIPEKWTESKPLLANLKGEVVPFQMGGTLDQPQMDGRALGDFGKRIGFKSAGGLLQQLIEKRLEKKANGEIPAKTPRVRPPRNR